MSADPTQRRYLRHQSIWLADDGWSVDIIDQSLLPGQCRMRRLSSVADILLALTDGAIRGPGLVAVAAAYALALAARRDPDMVPIMAAWHTLAAHDPRCPRLRGTLDRMREVMDITPPADRAARAYTEAESIAGEDLAANMAIGRHGLSLLRRVGVGGGDGRPQTLLLLSESGWLSGVGWGSASAPLFLAQEQVELRRTTGGVLGEDVAPPHVVTLGPLSTWEMVEAGIPHSPCDLDAAAELVRRRVVERLFVAALRTTARGDTLAPAGTAHLARVARDAGVPVSVAVPAGAIHWQAVTPGAIAAPGMDILTLGMISGFITDRGLCQPDPDALADRFPDHEPLTASGLPAANDA